MTTTTPTTFPIHTLDSAPLASKPSLQRLKETVGMIPHLAGAMAESPQLIEAFVTARAIFQSGSFTPAEREVIMLTNAVTNECGYCRAIHSTFALGAGVPSEEVRTLRGGESPAEPRLAALSRFARKVVRDRGHLSEADFDAFYGAGFSQAQALEVLLAVALSTIANYAAHFARPPLDEALKAQA